MTSVPTGIQRGRVKWFDSKKAYGFIVADNVDYFVHDRNVVGDFEIAADDNVEFTATTGRRGPRATNVRIVSK